MARLAIECARSEIATTLEQARAAVGRIGFRW